MAFNKVAKGTLIKPGIAPGYWENYISRAKGRVKIASKTGNLINQASEILGKPFEPNDYLLSHVTIVCSVDVVDVPKSKLGKLNFDGQTINRKWADYRVTPETDKFINNNLDCFSRGVLTKSAHTFVGGQNYVEHIQVEALSKGRLIDAAIRDIGPSIYVDLLVATEKKFTDLIDAINSGRMATLSMGCQVTSCICTKCGNVAKDETDLCTHIKYAKGQQFFDDLGQMHRVAELCGHPSIGPTGGVNFIEASWVGVPAFQGAVLRNTLEASPHLAEKMEHILSTVPEQWEDQGNLKAASSAEVPHYKLAFGAFEDVEEQRAPEAPEEEAPEEEAPEAQEEEADPLENAKNELFQNFVDDVQDNVQKVIRTDGQEEALYPGESSMNDSIQSQASVVPQGYAAAVSVIKKISNSSQQFIDNLALYNTKVGILFPVEIYRTSAKVGSIGKFASSNEYLHACRQTLAVQSLTKSQRVTLLMLGELLQNRSH